MGDLDGRLCCKKASNPESIAAMAARNIVKGERIIFDIAHNTADLVRLKELEMMHACIPAENSPNG